MIHHGNLTITKHNAADFAALTSVGGYLYIDADAQLPALTSVYGHAMPSAQDADARIRRIAEIVLSNGDALQMVDWHTCDTTHCLAGWAIHNEGEAGYALERETSPAAAGAILLGVEAASKFFKDNDAVMTWLRSKVEVAA